MRRNLVVLIIALAVVGWGMFRLAPLRAQGTAIPRDTIFVTTSNNTGRNEIYQIIPGRAPQLFANVNPGVTSGSPWICPIGVGPNGHLYVVSWGNGGTLWDLTAGGDRTADKPVATSLFAAAPGKMCGIAFDAAGDVFVNNSEKGAQPIMKVAPDGKVSALQGTYDQPRGMAVLKNAQNQEILYVAQASDGTVRAYNLTDDQPITAAFATGFPVIANHTPGSMVVDRRGHILLLWRTSSTDGNSGAVFDITAGGDFSNLQNTPPLVSTLFRMDVNQMAVDSQNNLYVAGNDSQTLWLSLFLGDQYTGFIPIAGQEATYINDGVNDIADCEAVAIAP
jgi:hypothetical protein